MIYATVADLEKRTSRLELVQLTDLENIPPSVIDTGLVETKIADACALIDGYVGQIYRLPLAGCLKPADQPDGDALRVAPPVLVRIACDLARYYLHSDLAPEHEVYRRYQSAMKDLQAIADGKATLACPWGGTPGDLLAADVQSGGNEVFWQGSPRQITDESLQGFA